MITLRTIRAGNTPVDWFVEVERTDPDYPDALASYEYAKKANDPELLLYKEELDSLPKPVTYKCLIAPDGTIKSLQSNTPARVIEFVETLRSMVLLNILEVEYTFNEDEFLAGIEVDMFIKELAENDNS